MSQSKGHQIVRLREMLKKWRWRAFQKAHSFSDRGTRTDGTGSVRTKRSISLPNIKDGGRSSRGGAAAAAKVPAGHLAVYVGEERKRFVIKMWYLSHPLFKALLKKTEEEMGFQREGALALPCEVAPFEQLVRIIQSSSKAQHHHSHSILREDSSAEDEKYEELLRQLLESAELSQSASHALCNRSHTHAKSLKVASQALVA